LFKKRKKDRKFCDQVNILANIWTYTDKLNKKKIISGGKDGLSQMLNVKARLSTQNAFKIKSN